MATTSSQIPVPAPLRLAGNVAGDWKRFRGQWINYAKAVKLASEEADCQAAVFLACIGPDAYELFETFEFASDEDRSDLTKIMDAFEAHCVGEVNVVYERYVLYQRCQENGESFDTFLSDVRRLIKSCDFGAMEDSAVRDRIVMGIRDDATRRKLLQTRKLDLKGAIDICRASESAAKHLRAMSKPDVVQAVQSRKNRDRGRPKQTADNRRPTDGKRASTPGRRCQYCDRNHEPTKTSCPAFGKTCKKCGRRNHFSSVCRSTDRPNVCELVESDNEVLAVDGERCTRLYSRLNVGNRTIRFLLDCGATVNLLPAPLIDQLGPVAQTVRPSESNLRMFDDTRLQTDGMVTLPVTHPKTGQTELLDFYIAKTHNQPLLGIDACLKYELLHVNHQNICSLSAARPSPLTIDEVTTEFHDVFEGYGKMDGKVTLKVDPTVPPVRMPLRKLPVPIKDRVSAELKQLQENGIIAPVTEPTAWLSALLVVSKAQGGVRLCIDPKPLNRALMRDHYSMPTIDDILPDLTKAKCFTTVDTKNAFWHLELDEPSSFLTSFQTPFGKFRWLRMPFGISPAPEIFQRRMHETLSGLNGVACIADDVLVYGCGDTLEEAQRDHDANVRALLHRCRATNLKLNMAKFRLNRKSVPFMGHVLTDAGVSVDDKKVEAILKMPPPTDRQGVLRLLGMATYLARFTPGFSEITAPLRQLLKRDSEFQWDDAVHGEALTKLKRTLSNAPVLRYYDVNKDVLLQCDSSQSGLGAVLLQDNLPVEFASRALTATEQSYAQIEKELLAVCYSLEHWHSYTYGRFVRIETDHKPLIAIMKKSLTTAPKRLQRMLLRLQRYTFELVFRPGSQVVIADALSRAYPPESATPTKFAEELATLVNDEQDEELRMVASPETLQRITEAAVNDEVYQALKAQIAKGWPADPTSLPEDLRIFYPYAEELVTSGDYIYKGHRIFVPAGARHWITERIHRSHIGVNGCLRRARETVFWPEMNKQLKENISKCEVCQRHQAAGQKEPLLPHAAPERPWQKVGTDIFMFHGKNYLITADYSSSYFEIDRLASKRVKDIVYCLKGQFARHGIPEICFSDCSPFAAQEFQAFAKAYEFVHITSSPRYPVSNGKVENAVRTAKRLMTKALEDKQDPFLALLEFRNTPSESLNLSPAQIMFGRRTRTTLPVASHLLGSVAGQQTQTALNRSKTRQAKYYNRGSKAKPVLPEGQTVRFKVSDDADEWQKGEIARALPYRAYQIRLPDGTTRRRTSKHVRFSPEDPIVLDDADTPAVSTTPAADTTPTDPSRQTTDEPATSRAKVTRSKRPVITPPSPTAPTLTTRSGRAVIRPARYR